MQLAVPKSSNYENSDITPRNATLQQNVRLICQLKMGSWWNKSILTLPYLKKKCESTQQKIHENHTHGQVRYSQHLRRGQEMTKRTHNTQFHRKWFSKRWDMKFPGKTFGKEQSTNVHCGGVGQLRAAYSKNIRGDGCQESYVWQTDKGIGFMRHWTP